MISHKSSFIEEKYVNGQDINIKFPDNKRNLIYIYLESMEATYLSEELGGSFKENLIPNLSTLANEGINFSSNLGLGGYYTPTCTGWTIAALFAHTAGVHLDIPIDTNNYEG
ncbi:MAG: phosphoglycerol transferase, partial [Lachnospiraceae bacterium]